MKFNKIILLTALSTSLMAPPPAPAARQAERRVRRNQVERTRPAPSVSAPQSAPLTTCDRDNAPDRMEQVVNPALVHLLNRAAFGPTPALLWEVECKGREVWIEQQLWPQLIADPELEARLAIYPTLQMTPAELFENYRPPEPGEPGRRENTPAQILIEISSALLVRAVHSQTQLEEVLVDFWFNHFNVFANEGPTRYAIISYLRDSIRPHVLGKFEDLLLATAESPAMLYYLDNYLNVRAGSRGRNSGINENYGRELLELHTVGVEGGYDQNDVIEVAKAFTGWTIREPDGDQSGFVYVPRFHDDSADSVMGYPISTTGIEQGREVIRFLAGLPATADFIAAKLAGRFVADDPPESLVRKLSERFMETGGDLREVMKTLLLSEEFNDPRYRLVKVKSPFEIVASSLRAIDAEVVDGLGAARLVGLLGQPNLFASPPTGWKEDADAVTSVGGMLARFEAAYNMAANRVPGVIVDPLRWNQIDAGSLGSDRILLQVLQNRAGSDTKRAMRLAHRKGADSLLLGAMALGSPEFQLQ